MLLSHFLQRKNVLSLHFLQRKNVLSPHFLQRKYCRNYYKLTLYLLFYNLLKKSDIVRFEVTLDDLFNLKVIK